MRYLLMMTIIGGISLSWCQEKPTSPVDPAQLTEIIQNIRKAVAAKTLEFDWLEMRFPPDDSCVTKGHIRIDLKNGYFNAELLTSHGENNKESRRIISDGKTVWFLSGDRFDKVAMASVKFIRSMNGQYGSLNPIEEALSLLDQFEVNEVSNGKLADSGDPTLILSGCAKLEILQHQIRSFQENVWPGENAHIARLRATSSVVVFCNPTTNVILGTIIRDKENNPLVISRFRNLILNSDFPIDLFQYAPPSNVKIVDIEAAYHEALKKFRKNATTPQSADQKKDVGKSDHR